MNDKRLLKVVILGDSGVGKTSILENYVNNRFNMHTKSTLGVNCMAKTLNINQTKVTLQIYDTIGQERFQPKLEDIRRGCEICIFVCDITKESSFNSLDDWLSDFITGPNIKDPEKFPLLLLGNKLDLSIQRVVAEERAKSWCHSRYQMLYFEVSAKSGTNVEEAFQAITRKALNIEQNGFNMIQTIPESIRISQEVFDPTSHVLPRKIIFLGESTVGKSSLLMRYAKNTFSERYIRTLDVDFYNKTVEYEGKSIRLQLMDTAGHERHHALTGSFYRGALGCVLVFDLTRNLTFKLIEHWKKEFVRHSGITNTKGFPFILLGNKVDLLAKREVSIDMAVDYAKDEGLAYFEVSAKNGHHVNDAFEELVKQIIRYEKGFQDNDLDSIWNLSNPKIIRLEDFRNEQAKKKYKCQKC